MSFVTVVDSEQPNLPESNIFPVLQVFYALLELRVSSHPCKRLPAEARDEKVFQWNAVEEIWAMQAQNTATDWNEGPLNRL